MSVGRQITTRRNFLLKSLPPDVNPLAMIIESVVLPESVRRHEAKANRQPWTFYYMGGGTILQPALMFLCNRAQ